MKKDAYTSIWLMLHLNILPVKTEHDLKNKKILTFSVNTCTIVRALLITCYENKDRLRLTESKSYVICIFIRSAQAAAAYVYTILQVFYFP